MIEASPVGNRINNAIRVQKTRNCNNNVSSNNDYLKWNPI